MARKASLSHSRLSEFLAVVGSEAQTIDDAGNPITNEEAVARLIYKKALGWTEHRVVEDMNGNKSKIEEYHPPENWALQYIYERREGKAPVAQQDLEGRQKITAAQQVRKLATERMNKLALSAGAPKSGPPRYNPNG